MPTQHRPNFNCGSGSDPDPPTHFSHDLCFKIIYFSIYRERISRAPLVSTRVARVPHACIYIQEKNSLYGESTRAQIFMQIRFWGRKTFGALGSYIKSTPACARAHTMRAMRSVERCVYKYTYIRQDGWR